jgi:hypothetical protein
MWHRAPNTPPVLASLLLLALAITVAPTTARSQTLGTLPVTATVVAASGTIDALQATRHAIDVWALDGSQVSHDVATVVQVDVAAPASFTSAAATEPQTLVVNVEFLKN